MQGTYKRAPVYQIFGDFADLLSAAGGRIGLHVRLALIDADRNKIIVFDVPGRTGMKPEVFGANAFNRGADSYLRAPADFIEHDVHCKILQCAGDNIRHRVLKPSKVLDKLP